MSVFDSILAGVGFRTSHPEFEPDQEITVIVTDIEDGEPVARVGDTKLRLDGAPRTILDKRVRVRVDSFDVESHVGRATHLETIEETQF